MPTGPVDDQGSSIFFSDSGPVSGFNDYTTLVVYHGSAFNGHAFDKLLPLAEAANVRLIIPNRRHYKGSTPYSTAELEDLNTGSRHFLERAGKEIAFFLLWLIATQDIPKKSTNQQGTNMGGIVLMGWSMGIAHTLALLGQQEAVGEDTYKELRSYLCRLINYDAPFLAFGYPQPEGYNPFADPTLRSPAAVFENFSIWNTTYYNHPDAHSLEMTGLDTTKQKHPSEYAQDSTIPPPTFTQFSQCDIERIFENEVSTIAESPMYVQMQPEIAVQAERALFCSSRMALPEVEFVTIFCTMANWYTLAGYFAVRKRFEGLVQQGKKVRKQRFYSIVDANHHVHWDAPEEMFAVVLRAMHET